MESNKKIAEQKQLSENLWFQIENEKKDGDEIFLSNNFSAGDEKSESINISSHGSWDSQRNSDNESV